MFKLIPLKYLFLTFVNGEVLHLFIVHVHSHDQVLHVACDYVHLEGNLKYSLRNQAFHVVFVADVGVLVFVHWAVFHDDLVLFYPTGQHHVCEVYRLIGYQSSQIQVSLDLHQLFEGVASVNNVPCVLDSRNHEDRSIPLCMLLFFETFVGGHPLILLLLPNLPLKVISLW